MKKWQDVNAIYQIYPRSFMDANGDGIGDIRGIISKLDYLKSKPNSLGVDAIWLSPFYPSPMADFGYDVSDYYGVHPMFGSIDDIKRLIFEAHAREINVMIDFVPNHTSDQHEWFKAASSSRDNPMRDFYVWRDPKPDGSPPNNWLSIFGGPAWQWHEETGQYYLHTFLKEQPDLNWDNVKVRWEMKKVLRYWMEMGVDGIRADAVRWIAKDPDLRDDLLNPGFVAGGDPFDSLIHSNSRYGRDLFRYLSEMTDIIAEYDNRIMIFEDYPDSIYSTRDQYLGFYGINPKVSMPFNFEGMWAKWGAEYFAKFINEFQGMLRPEHVPVYCFGNHDQHRLATRFGYEQARLIAVLQLTLPGLPVIYYGDELGMKNVDIKPEEVQDPVEIRKPGLGQGRDPERTPMRWNGQEYAGFSNVKPWLPVGEGYETNNVAVEMELPQSFLSLYKQLLAARSEKAVLRGGDYRQIDVGGKNVFAYERSNNKEKLFVLLNFDSEPAYIEIPERGKVIISSHATDGIFTEAIRSFTLRSYAALIVEVVN